MPPRARTPRTGGRAKRNTPVAEQSTQPAGDRTDQLPRVPIDLDLFAQGVALDKAITTAHDDGEKAAEARTAYAKDRHQALLAYALTDIATRWPGFMDHYYAVAGQPLFTPPEMAAATDETVELPRELLARAGVPIATPPPAPPVMAPPDDIVDAEIVGDDTAAGVPRGNSPAFVAKPDTSEFFAPKDGEGR
jgi:hypothetical protein